MNRNDALLTDLYELTMLKSYLDHGMHDTAVFEFFVRRLPKGRNFLLCAGIEQVVSFLQGLHFDEGELAWLQSHVHCSSDMLDYLARLHFEGDVWAMPEGTIFFPDEPVLRITAPLPLAQLVETRIINILHFQILIASKAVRMVLAAPDKQLVDFGLRRTHEADAGLMAARAGFIAGLDGSSNVLAARTFDIPVFGTMAHAYVQAHGSEKEAFIHYARSHPGRVVLLIDTYDTEAAAHKVVDIAPQLADEGIAIDGVRIDSGDLAMHARGVRRILDEGGLREVRIMASGNLDEYRLQGLCAADAPIDGFGIGTRMNTSSDAPYLDCAYKLQEYAGIARRKVSEGKATWPGRKQGYRQYRQGIMVRDTLTLENEACTGEPLLQPLMRRGELAKDLPSLKSIRAHAQEQLAALPQYLRQLERADEPYPVIIAQPLRELTKELDSKFET